MKNYKKIAAFTFAMMTCFSTTGVCNVTAADEAAKPDAPTQLTEAQLPDWIPTDFSEAYQFDQKYGKTHTDGKFVCFVYRDYYHEIDEPDGNKINYSEDSDITAPVFQGNYFYDDTDPHLIVSVYELNNQTLSFTFSENGEYGLKEHPLASTYKFVTDKDGNAVEDDMYSWVPDSVAEFKDYLSKYGSLSVKDNLIILCDSDIQATRIDLEQFGTAYLTEYMESTAHSALYWEPWSECYRMKLYTSEEKGDVTAKWTTVKGLREEVITEVTADMTISGENNAVYMYGEDEELPAVLRMPKWVPTNFYSAYAFCNEYGRTFVKDGYVCYVNTFTADTDAPHGIVIDEDSDVKEAMTSLDYFGNYYDWNGPDEKIPFGFSVSCFKIPENSSLKFYDPSLNHYSAPDEKMEKCLANTFSFVSDAEGNVTETDIYSTIPDSYDEWLCAEYENGAIYIDGENLICLEEKCTDCSTTFTQNGSGKLEEWLCLDVSGSYIFDSKYDWNPRNYVHVYKAAAASDVEATWTKTCEDSPCSYEGSVGVKLTISDQNKISFAETVEGDVNGDGKLSVSDVVLLEKWLMGAPDIKMNNTKSADLCKDGVIDVYDLCVMKQNLCEQ